MSKREREKGEEEGKKKNKKRCTKMRDVTIECTQVCYFTPIAICANPNGTIFI